MSRALRPLYWDANVFLSYVEGTPGRVAVIDAVLTDASRRAEIQIFTSAVSIAEVAFTGIERSGGTLDPTVEHTIEALWNDPLIHVVEVGAPIAAVARRLVRDSVLIGPRLKPMDAIHLATARSLGVVEMHTYDTALHKHSGRFGFPIHDPIATRFQP